MIGAGGPAARPGASATIMVAEGLIRAQGVKAREATRVAGLALTPSTDQALAALIWGERTQAVDSGAVLEAPALVAGFDDVAMVSEAVQ